MFDKDKTQRQKGHETTRRTRLKDGNSSSQQYGAGTTPMQSSHIPKSTLRHNLPTIMTITTVLLLATIIPIAIVYSRPKPSEQSCNPTMNLGTTYTPPATLSNITFTTSPIPSNLLWPKPRSVTSGETTLVIDPWMFELELKRTSPRLQRAFGRFVERFAAVGCRGEGEKMKVMVELESGDEVAIADAAESYSLVVDKDGVVIKAENTVGALRALETLSQLIIPNTKVPAFALKEKGCDGLKNVNGYKPGFTIPNTPWSINDSPAYPHRGLLLDTSRHYIPVPSLLRTIEGLAYSKLNVLHWHIVDSQSFPVVSTSVPGLSVGAYSPFQVYTKEDVGRVVEYAEERGVRVIPEFDVPGHAYSWGRGVEGLTVCDNVQPNWEKYCAAPPCGQIDITKPKNVEIVATLIREMTTWFKDPLFHLGTDEVNSACYSDNPTISSHMSRTSKSVNDLISDFLVSLHTVLFPLSRTPMHWEEAVLEHKANLDKRTIVQTWRKGESVNEILGMGYRVVRADFGAYYLDCGGGGWLERGGKSWCDPYKTWQDMYGFDLVGGVSGELRKGVLGGEVALWTEQSEAHTIDSKIWPRAAAAAESWWTFSDSSQKKVSEALPRLAVFTEKLVSMGIAASPLQPEWCRNGGCA